MNGTVVVDASALAAIVFNEPLAAEVVDRIGDREVVAPRLLAYELLNVAVRKIKKWPVDEPAIRRALARALADDVAIVWSDVEPEEVLDLALAKALTAYDASYLWLARHLRADLVTLDAQLAAADATR